jgi:hypothetical protein
MIKAERMMAAIVILNWSFRFLYRKMMIRHPTARTAVRSKIGKS